MNELVYGIHPIESILNIRPKQILKVYVAYKARDIRLMLLVKKAHEHHIYLKYCTRRWLDCKAQGALHQGIIAEVEKSSFLSENSVLNFLKICNTDPLLLILDGITDPHNMGACLRSAEAVGVNMVIVPRHCSAPINATVRKVSSGAVDRLSFVRVTNLSRILILLQKYNIWIVGTVIQSSYDIYHAKLTGPLALVMGSESRGIRRLTRQHCNELVKIPMIGSIESLNVSVATGICLFESLRQRQYLK